MADLTTSVGRVRLPNPIIAASGTFGFGAEMSAFYDISCLGAISTKGFTRLPKAGNPPPRVAECRAGMLNAVGLQNPGLESVKTHELPQLRARGAGIVANVAAETLEDYVYLCEQLQDSGILAIELNLSCPNVKSGCITFGSDPKATEAVTRACAEVSRIPLWVKLTPNVSSIVATAQAAARGGAEAVSLINTLLGLAIDLPSRRPVLRNNTGGYSGPAIKPVALRMVSEVYRHVDIPIVGMGGISSTRDVLEFIVAGASAVQIGTMGMMDPYLLPRIIEELPAALAALGADSVDELRGSLKYWD